MAEIKSNTCQKDIKLCNSSFSPFKLINSWENQGMEKFMTVFEQVGGAPVGTQELTLNTQLKCLEMAILKLTENRNRDDNERFSRGRIVFIGAFENDSWENMNQNQSYGS